MFFGFVNSRNCWDETMIHLQIGTIISDVIFQQVAVKWRKIN